MASKSAKILKPQLPTQVSNDPILQIKLRLHGIQLCSSNVPNSDVAISGRVILTMEPLLSSWEKNGNKQEQINRICPAKFLNVSKIADVLYDFFACQSKIQ